MKTTNYKKWLISILILSCGNPNPTTNFFKEDFHSKMTFHNNVLIKVENTDENGNQIFEKESQYVGEFWNGKYVTWINTKKLGKEGELEFKIWAHSNVGFKIYFPRKVNDSTEIEMIIEDGFDQDSSLVNKNQFGYINKINNSNELFNHPQILKMFEGGNKYHFKTSLIDTKGNVVKEIYFEESGDTASITSYVFDENGNEIYSNHDNRFEYHNQFDSLGNEIQSKRINFDVRKGTREIKYVEVWIRSFTNDNRLEEVLEKENSEIRRKETYEYDNGNLVNKTYYFIHDGKVEKYFEAQYIYEGNILIKQIEINYRDNEKKEKIVTYKER